MCVVSAISDNWTKQFPIQHPTMVPASPNQFPATVIPTVTRQEFDALRAEVEQLKVLLEAAKKFDEATGQKDCEKDEKVELLKKVAELVGVDLKDVLS